MDWNLKLKYVEDMLQNLESPAVKIQIGEATFLDRESLQA